MCDSGSPTPQRRRCLSSDNEKGPQAAAALQAELAVPRWLKGLLCRDCNGNAEARDCVSALSGYPSDLTHEVLRPRKTSLLDASCASCDLIL
jgi:hypothetical protein